MASESRKSSRIVVGAQFSCALSAVPFSCSVLQTDNGGKTVSSSDSEADDGELARYEL